MPEAPVPKVVLPEEVSVVKAPVPAVVTPRLVKFPAAGVTTPIVVPLIVPPVIATELEPKLLAVTNPDPKVTGRLVVVLMPKVPVPVISKMLELPTRFRLDPLTVKFPPRVVSPVPVVIAALLVVLRDKVPEELIR